jgi:hypothetical protein
MRVSNKNLILTLIITLTLLFGAVLPVAGQDAGEDVEITGTIVAIVLPTDTDPGSFDVETPEGIVTVFPGEEFDFTSIEVGDKVEVKGVENEDGSLTGTEIEIEEPDYPEPPEESVYPKEGYYCTQSETMHPMGARLAERYDMDYETLQGWFCDGFGWGQVMLALQTSKLTEGDPALLLQARSEGKGWGNIWKELGLNGKKDKDKNGEENEEENPETTFDKKDNDKKDKPNQSKSDNPNSNKNKDKDKKK